MTKKMILQALRDPLMMTRQDLIRQSIEILYQYRITCNPGSPAGQLILPESLKLLILYTLVLLKSDCLRLNGTEAGRIGGYPDPSADERAVALYNTFSMSTKPLILKLYPRLYKFEDGFGTLKRCDTPSSAHLTADGIFVLDCYDVFYICISKEVSPQILSDLFGVSQTDPTITPEFSTGSDAAESIRQKLFGLRGDRECYPETKLVILGSGSRVENRFLKYLTDDRTKIEQSYSEFLCFMHKEIQSKIQQR